MFLLDLTCPSPAEDLACDEALLEEADETGAFPEGLLRFYSSTLPCVVLGYGNRVAAEVNLDACTSAGVPILRRSSGGGTVMLGPGCLAYALILPVAHAPELESITGTNRHVMNRLAAAFTRLLGHPVDVRGHTDLVLDGRKFSGNAQRRRRRALLFHGTFLLDHDLSRIEQCLRLPERRPEYRADRTHRDFLTNLAQPAATVKTAVATAWNATMPLPAAAVPERRLHRLLNERYRDPGWNLRF